MLSELNRRRLRIVQPGQARAVTARPGISPLVSAVMLSSTAVGIERTAIRAGSRLSVRSAGRGLSVAPSGPAVASDYRTNIVVEYQAGDNANFSLTTDDINVENAIVGGSDFNLTSQGDGGYTVKSKHNTTDAINLTKTVKSNVSDNQSRYLSGVAGTLNTVITGTGLSLVLVIKPRSFRNKFSAPDPVFYALNNLFRLQVTSATNLQFRFGTGAQSIANATITVGAAASNWQVVICTYDNDKARIYVDGVEGTAGASSAGLVAGNLTTRIGANSDTSSGGMFDGARKLARVYNEVLGTMPRASLLSYFRSQWTDLN